MVDTMGDHAKAFLGIAAPTTGVVISLSTVIAWLQIVSLAVGIVVGTLSAISLARKLYGRRN